MCTLEKSGNLFINITMVLHAKELGVKQLIYEVFNINGEVQPLMVIIIKVWLFRT